MLLLLLLCPLTVAVEKLMKIFSRNSAIYRQILGHIQNVDGPMKIKDRQRKATETEIADQ